MTNIKYYLRISAATYSSTSAKVQIIANIFQAIFQNGILYLLKLKLLLINNLHSCIRDKNHCSTDMNQD